MYQITPVVRHLLIINVLMYLGTMLMGDPEHALMDTLIKNPSLDFSEWGRYQLAVFFPTSDYFKPYQVVTHMFMHGNPTHLFFNMFALFMFGPPVEATFGPKRFFQYYLITGFGAYLLQIATNWVEMEHLGGSPFLANVPMVGASGAVFGLLAAYGILFPNNRIMLLFPPIPMKAKYFVLIYAGLELFLGIGRFTEGIAHFAHVGGALFGFLLILFWRRRP
jgi:membrane associated rhomboid family serine protease